MFLSVYDYKAFLIYTNKYNHTMYYNYTLCIYSNLANVRCQFISENICTQTFADKHKLFADKHKLIEASEARKLDCL